MLPFSSFSSHSALSKLEVLKLRLISCRRLHVCSSMIVEIPAEIMTQGSHVTRLFMTCRGFVSQLEVLLFVSYRLVVKVFVSVCV